MTNPTTWSGEECTCVDCGGQAAPRPLYDTAQVTMTDPSRCAGCRKRYDLACENRDATVQDMTDEVYARLRAEVPGMVDRRAM